MKKFLLPLILIFLSHFGYGQIGFPYCETFETSNSQEATIFGGDARLVDGVLRLTENLTSQTGYVYIDIPFPSFYGIKAEFEYFSYGGDDVNRADGLSVFLFDAATQNFAPGGFGGSLGYAQRNDEPGLTNAYMGIGFDEFGNFGNSAEGKNGGFPGSGTSLVPNAVVVRGPGNGLTGYPFIIGRKTLDAGNLGLSPANTFEISSGGIGTQRVTDPNQVGYRKVFIDLEPVEQGVGYNFKVDMLVTTTPNNPRRVPIFDRAYAFEPPQELKIGFAASTGGFTNYHEIKNLVVQVSADDQLQNPEGVDFSDIASCEGQENTYFITDEEVVLPNEDSRIRCLQFYASLEDIEEETSDICSQAKCIEANRELTLPQGTFRAGDNSGDFTFFSNEGFTDEEVTVYYTITDNYGKTSSGNAMTLTIQESPEPIGLFLEGETTLIDEQIICEGDVLSLVAQGEEVYERFEWYRNDELIEGAGAFSYQVSEPGVYEVLGYNRKNCPTISNTLLVTFPNYQSIAVSEPLVGCEPGQSVNALDFIPEIDFETYDYLLTGEGLVLENEEIIAIPLSGEYLLQSKPRLAECFDSGIEVEVIIREEELTGDFDFVVAGTTIRGDADGGIFPDDVIQFTDLSEESVEWLWDFGDGNSSTLQNPTHVYGKKGVFPITLSITDELGCQFRIVKELSITRSYRVMVPTGFTPQSTENKFFLPKHKGLVSIELLIFNSWGGVIFRTDDLQTEGWDGRLDGKLMDAGFYVFRFDGVATDGEKVTRTGKFKLIR
ncbi:PKD domain-containing protein [Algoriphagus namhaensis]|uniref:PKD domain-containing protein n=1 Tax=Algoriphagus namhaensis TaxID=915353 RepID=A0ABV8APU0_9BACT